MEQEHIIHKSRETITCDVCGCQVNRNNLARHQITNKCKSYVKPIDNEEYIIIIIIIIIIHVNITCVYVFVLLGLFNFILKEWLTIIRGRSPMVKTLFRSGVVWVERSDDPNHTTSVDYCTDPKRCRTPRAVCYEAASFSLSRDGGMGNRGGLNCMWMLQGVIRGIHGDAS